MDNNKYWLEKMAHRKTGYPIAMVAYYGPDNHFASKVVVGILKSETEKEATELKKWFATDLDVRIDSFC